MKGCRRTSTKFPSPAKIAKIALFQAQFFKNRARGRPPSADGRASFWGFNHAAFDVALVGISRLMGPFFSGYASAPAGKPCLARASFSGYATVYIFVLQGNIIGETRR